MNFDPVDKIDIRYRLITSAINARNSGYSAKEWEEEISFTKEAEIISDEIEHIIYLIWVGGFGKYTSEFIED